MISRNLSAVFLTLLMPVFAKASSVETFLMVPWSYIQATYLAKAENLTFNEQNISFKISDIPVQLSRVSGYIDYTLNPLEVQNDKTQISSQSLTVLLQISGFNVEKEFIKTVGGIQVKIKLKAECASFTLSQDETQLTSTFRWMASGNTIKSKVESLNLNWPDNSWKVTPINCSGPKGFADVIQNELQAKLAKPDDLVPFIKAKLELKINNTLEQYLKPFRQNQIFKNIEYRITNVESIFEKGFLFKLILQINNANPTKIAIELNEELLNQDLRSPLLVFNRAGIQTISQDLIPQRWDSKLENFEGFKKLMRSRFMQLFVWPDLWQYPKSASFPMLINLDKNSKISLNDDLTATLKGSLNTWIQSERDGKNWDYLYLKSALQAVLKYKIETNQLVFDITSLTQSTDLKFFPDYLLAFLPSDYIAKKTLEKSVVESLKTKSFQWPLPVVKINEELSLKADSIQSTKSYLLIELK